MVIVPHLLFIINLDIDDLMSENCEAALRDSTCVFVTFVFVGKNLSG